MVSASMSMADAAELPTSSCLYGELAFALLNAAKGLTVVGRNKRQSTRIQDVTTEYECTDLTITVFRSQGWTEISWEHTPEYEFHSDVIWLLVSPQQEFDITLGLHAQTILEDRRLIRMWAKLDILTSGLVTGAIERYLSERAPEPQLANQLQKLLALISAEATILSPAA